MIDIHAIANTSDGTSREALAPPKARVERAREQLSDDITAYHVGKAEQENAHRGGDPILGVVLGVIFAGVGVILFAIFA